MSKRIRDKWKAKSWYTIVAPSYFGNTELGMVPIDDPSKLIGRIMDATLYDITNDLAHQYLKVRFQVKEVEGKVAKTIFKGHEYVSDYLRSLVRRRTTYVDGIFSVMTKDGYKLRVSICAFTISRIKTSQEKAIREIMGKVVNEKASQLTYDQFVQEAVLGKIASDVYNEAKRIVPLRHVGVRKSRLVSAPH